MGAQNDMSLAYERRLAPATAAPEAEAGINIDVVFTTVEATLAALRKAGDLASRLNACIHLVVPQVVPYPTPLASPPVLVDFNERRFHVIAGESAVETTVLVYLCRDSWKVLSTVLRPHSLVVVGGRRRWWPTGEERLARRLRRSEHEVIFTETE